MRRMLVKKHEIDDLQRLGDVRRTVQMAFLSDSLFATIERLHAKYSKLDLYNIVSAAIALERKVPLAVWNDGQYTELRRHEGLTTVDWSK